MGSFYSLQRAITPTTVLDNASADDSDDFTDGAPASDSDPYSPSETSVTYTIDSSKFPKPVPIFGPLFGFNSQLLGVISQARIAQVTKMLQRPPTEEEATAITYWTSKQLSLMSYGAPCGIAIGAWRAYSSASTFRFPFYQPNLESFNSRQWPSNKLALVSGSRSAILWHATRLLAYGLVGGILGQIFFASYAMSVTSVGEYTDPRLKNYIEAVRKMAQTARGRLPNQAKQPGMGDVMQQKDTTTPWEDHRRETGDDASPTDGGYGGAEQSDIPAIVENGVMRNHNTKAQETRQIPMPQPGSAENKANTFQMVKEPRSLDGDFNHASPTGGRGTADVEDAGTSAWDRIRQQASRQPAGIRGSSGPSGRGQQPSRPGQSAWRRDRNTVRQERHHNQREMQDGASTGDSFAFPTAEEERQLARSEAQKEFDARVEQERRGGQFSADGNGQERW